MSDDVTKRAAQLLLKGAKMLQIACPICHQPIYQLQDSTMLCVQCDRNVEFATSEYVPITSSQQKITKELISDNPIQQKIEQLSLLLQAETDPQKIVEYAETIRKLEQIKQS